MGGTDWGYPGMALMGRAMLCKSLIQFSADGWGCVSSLQFGFLQKDLCQRKLQLPGLLYSMPPAPWQATLNPHLCQRLLDTHRQVWLSILRGHCSFLLGPVVYKVLFVSSKSLFSQSCGSSVIKSHWPPKSNSLGVLSPFAGSPGWKICCWP